MTKNYRYKVSGTVKFFVDDIVSSSERGAINQVKGNLADDVQFAGEQGTLELIGELSAENLEPCNKNKFHKIREC
jgi:hypothetical protein